METKCNFRLLEINAITFTTPFIFYAQKTYLYFLIADWFSIALIKQRIGFKSLFDIPKYVNTLQIQLPLRAPFYAG